LKVKFIKVPSQIQCADLCMLTFSL